jgi:hypothetical protein
VSATLDDSTHKARGSLSATEQIASNRAVDPDLELRVAGPEPAKTRDVERGVEGRAQGLTLHRGSVAKCPPMTPDSAYRDARDRPTARIVINPSK